MKENDALKNDLRFGATLMVILVAVNVVGFWFAIAIKSQLVLFFSVAFLAAVDAGLIIYYYMHVMRLFESDGKGGH